MVRGNPAIPVFAVLAFNNMDEHIRTMNKISNRDRLLTEGLKVVHERGYLGASVRDIVQAAGVPQGSFTNHFASKEAFALEVIELYYAGSAEIVARSLQNAELAPLDRIRAYISENRKRIAGDGIQNGCLYGNLSVEAVEHSDLIRKRLDEIFSGARRTVQECLEAAITDGSVAANLDAEQIAAFFIASLQGAILLAKTQRNLSAIDQFENILFSSVLRA